MEELSVALAERALDVVEDDLSQLRERAGERLGGRDPRDELQVRLRPEAAWMKSGGPQDRLEERLLGRPEPGDGVQRPAHLSRVLVVPAEGLDPGPQADWRAVPDCRETLDDDPGDRLLCRTEHREHLNRTARNHARRQSPHADQFEDAVSRHTVRKRLRGDRCTTGRLSGDPLPFEVAQHQPRLALPHVVLELQPSPEQPPVMRVEPDSALGVVEADAHPQRAGQHVDARRPDRLVNHELSRHPRPPKRYLNDEWTQVRLTPVNYDIPLAHRARGPALTPDVKLRRALFPKVSPNHPGHMPNEAGPTAGFA